jgi:Predicted transcriptional regulator, contains C-terminal CBS domains
MITRVVTIPDNMKLFEVVKKFKEDKIGRVIVMEGETPVGILTHSDLIKVFPSL